MGTSWIRVWLSRTSKLTLSIEAKTNPINNQQQQSFTPVPIPINVTSDPFNAFGSILSIYQPTITPRPAQIGSILPADLPQQPFNASANPYTQIPTAQIRTTQFRKTEITKPIPDNTNCILSPGSTEDVWEGLSALLTDYEPLDKMMQVYVSSIDIVKNFEHHRKIFLSRSGRFEWIRSTDPVDCMSLSPGQI